MNISDSVSIVVRTHVQSTLLSLFGPEKYNIWIKTNQNILNLWNQLDPQQKERLEKYLEKCNVTMKDLESAYKTLSLVFKHFMKLQPSRFMQLWKTLKMTNLAKFLTSLNENDRNDFITWATSVITDLNQSTSICFYSIPSPPTPIKPTIPKNYPYYMFPSLSSVQMKSTNASNTKNRNIINSSSYIDDDSGPRARSMRELKNTFKS